MFGLKEERKSAAGEEEISPMERGEDSSPRASESEKDLGWKGSAEKSGLPKGGTLTKRSKSPRGFWPMSSRAGSGSGECDASGRPRSGSELART